MTRNPYFRLALIGLLLLVAAWIDLSKNIDIPNPFVPGTMLVERNVDISLGLDLRGGLQALLEVPAGVAISSTDLDNTRTILENRANGLGVSEVLMQSAPPNRIVAEFPGVSDPDKVMAALKQTGLLEFVDMGTTALAEGSPVLTDYHQGANTLPTPVDTAVKPTATTATTGPTATPAAGAAGAATATPVVDKTIYHTVMTGAGLKSASVTTGASGYEISFTLKDDAKKIFGDYTTSHIGKILAIVLDGKVISAPTIQGAITDGTGVITGNFTHDSANILRVQLSYGSLPVPVGIVSSQTVGATLGAESVQKSLLAGIIGLTVVILFMLLYYRVPGVIADLALITYAIISLAIFKAWPIVLTLPGIAGFILSIGMAVDANILI
ncbi:MAG: protein translocase subunit SecD, partial [Anaerolineales bacterium]